MKNILKTAFPANLSVFAIVVVALTGCVSSKSVKSSSVEGKAVLVVPVTSQSMILYDVHLATYLGSGIVGAAIENNATSDSRESFSEILNNRMADFVPVRILAEECTKLLQSSPRVSFRSVSMSAKFYTLEGTSQLLVDEPRPFKHDGGDSYYPWRSAMLEWVNGPSDPQVFDGVAVDPNTIALEAGLLRVLVLHRKKIEIMMFLRLVDPHNGVVLGKTSYLYKEYKITPLTEDSDPSVFEADFRRCAGDLAQEGLEKLKIY